MGNKGKRNLFLGLILLEVFAYLGLVMFKNQLNVQAKWWIYIAAAFLFIFFVGCYRNFSHALKEDEKYGSVAK